MTGSCCRVTDDLKGVGSLPSYLETARRHRYVLPTTLRERGVGELGVRHGSAEVAPRELDGDDVIS